MSDNNEPKFKNELSQAIAGSVGALLQVMNKSDLALKGAEIGPVNQAMHNAGQLVLALQEGHLFIERDAANDDEPTADVVNIEDVKEPSDDEEDS